MDCLTCKWLYKISCPCDTFWFFVIRPFLSHSSAKIIDRQKMMGLLSAITASECSLYLEATEKEQEENILEYATLEDDIL